MISLMSRVAGRMQWKSRGAGSEIKGRRSDEGGGGHVGGLGLLEALGSVNPRECEV